jgi:hypothetical protein
METEEAAASIEPKKSSINPTNRLSFSHPLPIYVDDVLPDQFGAELALTLRFVGPDRIRGFKVKARVKQAFEHTDPRLVLAVVEGEGQKTSGFQDTIGFAPSAKGYKWEKYEGVTPHDFRR